MQAPILETARLTLRPFLDEDVDSFVEAIFKDPKVTLTLPHQPQTPEEEVGYAGAYSASYTSAWKTYGYGGWAVCSKSNTIAPEGIFLGFCGFVLGERPGKLPELGFGYSQSCWGKGVGYEAAVAATDWFFLQGKFESFYACADSFNTGSVRILEKLNMKYQGDEDLWGAVAAGEGALPVYLLDQATYRSNTSQWAKFKRAMGGG